MYEECAAKLTMDRCILAEGEPDEKVYDCTIVKWIQDEEYMYLSVMPEYVSCISLDAVYECRIQLEGEERICLGVVIDRYWNKSGGILKLLIQNGFYKTRVK